MKKTLVALATLAVAGGAFAQSPNARAIDASGVTLFGVGDVTVTRFTQDGAGSVTRMQGEGRNESSRLGIRGMEDIGGGWGAGFWFEAGVFYESGGGQNTTSNNTSIGQNGLSNGTNNGTTGSGATAAAADVVSLGATQGLTFNRASVVSLLNKGVGEIRLGRDYVPTFWNLTVFDPFGTVGAGAYTNLTFGTLHARPAVAPPGNPSPMVRTSNSVGWLSNDIGGFRFQLQTGLSEQISTCSDLLTTTGSSVDAGGNLCQAPAGDGKYVGGRAQYMSGPLHLAAAYGKTTYQDTWTAAQASSAGSSAKAYAGNYQVMNLGASYTIGATKLMAQYGTQEFGATSIYSGASTTGNAAAASAGNGVWTNAAAVGATNIGTTATTARKVTHTMLGLTHAVGAWTLKGSYGTAKMDGGQSTYNLLVAGGNPVATMNIEDGARQTQIAVGAVYDLSKRSAVYGTYSTLKTTGQNAASSLGISSQRNANLGESVNASAIDLGVRHRF